MSWWKLSISAPTALADDLAYLLAERLESAVEVQDETTMTRAVGHSQVVVGLAHEPTDAQVSAVRETLALLGLADAPVKTQRSDDESWREGWKAFFRGRPVSPRLEVRPPWEAPADPERRSIVIDPGLAFGTGQHETTRGVLGVLDPLLATLGPCAVLDVGTGSGILAIGAALLGASVVAVEIDGEALDNARENFALNGVVERVELRHGSVDVAPGRFDVVLANILARPLIELAPELTARTARHLVLAGLLAHDADAVRAAYPDLRLVERVDVGEWAILHLAV